MRQGPFPHRRLCCPPAQPVLRPHPTPCRLDATSRSGGYTHRLLLITARPGPARASPVPVPTFCPSRSPYPGGFLSACTSRSSAPSMAFAVNSAARHPLVPLRVSLTRLQDSLHAAGWTVAPPRAALDAALQHRAFPPGTGSLLPGLLAATRTGLPPAGGHGLTRGSPQRDHLLVNAVHPRCWAHESRASGGGSDRRQRSAAAVSPSARPPRPRHRPPPAPSPRPAGRQGGRGYAGAFAIPTGHIGTIRAGGPPDPTRAPGC